MISVLHIVEYWADVCLQFTNASDVEEKQLEWPAVVRSGV